MAWTEKVRVNYALSDGRTINKNDLKTADKPLLPKLFTEDRKIYDEIRLMLFERTPEGEVSEMLVKQDGFVEIKYCPAINDKSFRESLQKKGMRGEGFIV